MRMWWGRRQKTNAWREEGKDEWELQWRDPRE